ncbi:DUF3108 domain-containing protein [Gemmatimonas sp.]|jgi:hypothetical protein|uniref:DUF3108 domain-containing protein n=1 Tax=Gemmatimonas sp. TaxID=1962908 RepID=UPI0027BAC62B|nr:DUF3108 domain-containing protein [Gemmatimonas sp.]
MIRALPLPMVLVAGVALAAARAPMAGQPGTPAGATPVPFAVGEKLDYDVKFGSLKVGSGSMEVKELTGVRGRSAWHTVFTIKGGIPLYRVNDVYESWFDVATLNSLRYHQDVDEGSYERKRRFEIFPERGMFREGDKDEEPTVANPLDDGSFLYFVRTLSLDVGKSYEFPRYFKAQGNPVRIRVLRRETVTVPAGTFKTVVLQPTFQTKGIFSQNGKAEVWITDDDRRIMVQMKSKLSFGSLNLYLQRASGTK